MDATSEGGTISRAPALILVIVCILSNAGSSILTPLWLDALDQNGNASNTCGNYSSEHHIDAYTTMFIVNFLFAVLFAIIVFFSWCCCPGHITERERSYPKWQFVVIGVSDTLAAVCFVYASSGCRTAPYLQSIATNFYVPVTFVVRYIMLQRRPTCRKLVCAVLVLIAEFTVLIPDIFPELQTSASRKSAGGAEGVAGVLWPVCFFLGYVPLAIVATSFEKAVQNPNRERVNDSTNINMAYVLFWSYFFSLITLVGLFWTDIIPGFGMTEGITDFVKVFWFNIQCYFGKAGCSGPVIIFAVLCTICLVVMRVSTTYFLRYLEGANYLAIIKTIQTPVVFIFFTLFDENPFKWHPHAYLTTWLSIAALCIMIPAAYIYDTGAPEVRADNTYFPVIQEESPYEDTNPFSGEGEEEPLLNGPVLYGAVQRRVQHVT